MAHAEERGWVWCRRWQGAVSVVDCQYRRIEVVQFLYVGPVNPSLNCVNVVSDSKAMVGWRLAQVSNWQEQSQGVLCGGASALEFPICFTRDCGLTSASAVMVIAPLLTIFLCLQR